MFEEYRKKTMKNYYVESNNALWFVIASKNKREAHSYGVREFGRGSVKCIREATQKELDKYISRIYLG